METWQQGVKNTEGERDLWSRGEDVYCIKNVHICKGVVSQGRSGEQGSHTEADQERGGGLAAWVRRCGRGCLKVGNNGKLTGTWAGDTGRCVQDELSKGKLLSVGQR